MRPNRTPAPAGSSRMVSICLPLGLVTPSNRADLPTSFPSRALFQLLIAWLYWRLALYNRPVTCTVSRATSPCTSPSIHFKTLFRPFRQAYPVGRDEDWLSRARTEGGEDGDSAEESLAKKSRSTRPYNRAFRFKERGFYVVRCDGS